MSKGNVHNRVSQKRLKLLEDILLISTARQDRDPAPQILCWSIVVTPTFK
jgi:hypothetical protein